MKSFFIQIKGVVQGVGFRPFVYTLALKYDIKGWVNNDEKELMFIIEEAVAKNIIRKNRTQYFYGTDMLGNGIDDVISYLKEKKNQDIKMTILQEIKSK